MIKCNDNRFKNHNDTINKWKHTFYKTFQYANFRYKTYPIDVMSLSHAERSESYPIEKSYCKYSFQMETDALSDILFKTIHNYRCVLS